MDNQALEGTPFWQMVILLANFTNEQQNNSPDDFIFSKRDHFLQTISFSNVHFRMKECRKESLFNLDPMYIWCGIQSIFSNQYL